MDRKDYEDIIAKSEDNIKYYSNVAKGLKDAMALGTNKDVLGQLRKDHKQYLAKIKAEEKIIQDAKKKLRKL